MKGRCGDARSMHGERHVECVDARDEAGVECRHEGFSAREMNGDKDFGGVEGFAIIGRGRGRCFWRWDSRSGKDMVLPAGRRRVGWVMCFPRHGFDTAGGEGHAVCVKASVVVKEECVGLFRELANGCTGVEGGYFELVDQAAEPWGLSGLFGRVEADVDGCHGRDGA